MQSPAFFKYIHFKWDKLKTSNWSYLVKKLNGCDSYRTQPEFNPTVLYFEDLKNEKLCQYFQTKLWIQEFIWHYLLKQSERCKKTNNKQNQYLQIALADTQIILCNWTIKRQMCRHCHQRPIEPFKDIELTNINAVEPGSQKVTCRSS